jgi:DNA-binding MarR family transcriptional regulator
MFPGVLLLGGMIAESCGSEEAEVGATSIEMINRVLALSTCKGSELVVLIVLANFANDAGECWPGLTVIAKKARLSKEQVCRILTNLERVGEIRRSRSSGGRRKRTHYFISLTPENSEDSKTVNYTQQLTARNSALRNSVLEDSKTVTCMPHALNHHRTINKKEESDDSSRLSLRKRKQPDPAQAEAFQRFYQAYPRHIGRKPALAAWLKIDPDPLLTEKIMTAVARYAGEIKGTEQRFILHPATWLNQERWTDEHNGSGASTKTSEKRSALSWKTHDLSPEERERGKQRLKNFVESLPKTEFGQTLHEGLSCCIEPEKKTKVSPEHEK